MLVEHTLVSDSVKVQTYAILHNTWQIVIYSNYMKKGYDVFGHSNYFNLGPFQPRY